MVLFLNTFPSTTNLLLGADLPFYFPERRTRTDWCFLYDWFVYFLLCFAIIRSMSLSPYCFEILRQFFILSNRFFIILSEPWTGLLWSSLINKPLLSFRTKFEPRPLVHFSLVVLSLTDFWKLPPASLYKISYSLSSIGWQYFAFLTALIVAKFNNKSFKTIFILKHTGK